MATMISNLSPDELSEYLAIAIRKEFVDLLMEYKKRDTSTDVKPHFTRVETSKFFDVTPNCINDWVKKGILTPMKIGQRVYFSKDECMEVMFNQLRPDKT